MQVSCYAQDPLHKKKSSRVDCNTYCNGTDSRSHSKKGTSLPKENTPDKCGTWVQGSTAVSGVRVARARGSHVAQHIIWRSLAGAGSLCASELHSQGASYPSRSWPPPSTPCASQCNCGNCEAYAAAVLGPRTCSPDSTGTKGYCCSCSSELPRRAPCRPRTCVLGGAYAP